MSLHAIRDLVVAAEAAGWDFGDNSNVLNAARDAYAALLTHVCWTEAAGDRRIECDVIAPSVLADIRDRSRKVIGFENPLYPERRS